MRKLSQIWFEVQEDLFPFIEKQVEEPLTEKSVTSEFTGGH